MNLSNITTVQAEDVQRITTVHAQLHSMESYINPDVEKALRFNSRHAEMVGDAFSSVLPRASEDEQPENGDDDNALGVALIQPVTLGLEYSETRRDLFPTTRSLFANIEPVSTMLSFEDLQLIEAVLKRWSTERSNKSRADAFDGTTGTSGQAKTSVETYEHYDVVFYSERLGLGLKMENDQVVVSSIQNPKHSETISTGDSLIAVDRENFEGRSLAEVVNCLSARTRPISIRFSRLKVEVPDIKKPPNLGDPANEDKPTHVVNGDGHMTNPSDFYVASYTVRFRTGITHGLQVDKSKCGQFPVVVKVLPAFGTATSALDIDESNDQEIEATFEEQDVRIPRAGAVIVAIDDVPLQERGVEETWRILSTFTTVENKSEMSVSKRFYSLSFNEIDASLWGNIDTIDISASGIALSFIDDLNGRDMPLFRGKLSAIEVHAGRGLGAEARILDVNTPYLLTLGSDESGVHDEKNIVLSYEEIQDLHSESIITFSGFSKCAIDYFHPRIACWEPLLEPSQLFVLFEKQSGSVRSNRPGQIALEISDCILHDQIFRGNILPNQMSEPQMVSLNLTDSAAEVLVKASTQWKKWRRGSIPEETDGEDSESMPDGTIGEKPSFTDQTILSTASGDVADTLVDHEKKHKEGRQLAAQKAAQAALVFAQKRGADTSKKGESAKPFVFRNRTGVSVAFVQQGCRMRRKRLSQFQRNLSVVGEYTGLEDYDPLAVRELADQADSKFSMELLTEQNQTEENSPFTGNKQGASLVRNYEGRYPSLTVAIQAVAGVSVEPLVDLAVFKVGSVVRHLRVRKEVDSVSGIFDSTDYSIPVVWKVEIEDNRRILTLSTAVRVVSTGYNSPIEVGVQKDLEKDMVSEEVERMPITSIGVAHPESPLYLPLWLALKLESVSVYVRPDSREKMFGWGDSSVLQFGPLLGISSKSNENTFNPDDIGKWIWKETFTDIRYVRCDDKKKNATPVWLSVFGSSSTRSSPHVGSGNQRQGKEKDRTSVLYPEEEFNEVISVTLDSGLTLRNMLPMDVEWELAQSTDSLIRTVVDGSSFRQQELLPMQLFSDSQSLWCSALSSGECTEVFACDYDSKLLEARFKQPNGKHWSGWASLSFDESVDQHDDKEPDVAPDDAFDSGSPTSARQVNVQVTSDIFGVPLTFGVRIVPKLSLPVLDDPSRGLVYGLEVIIYAELWVRNLTTLPLNFGCPSYQLHESTIGPDGGHGVLDDSAARFTAESALMEIANLLEVGDKGTGLSNKAAREVATTGGIESLPNQECTELVEEVFEYIEVDGSMIKRRWWASESYDSYRENITGNMEENEAWKWINDSWVSLVVFSASSSFRNELTRFV